MLLTSATQPVAFAFSGASNTGLIDGTVSFSGNAGNTINCEFDGITTALYALENVICGQTYHIKIAIADGGTGATTAGGARINLGSTATGDAIFVAATQQAAWTALGIAPAGVVVGGTF